MKNPEINIPDAWDQAVEWEQQWQTMQAIPGSDAWLMSGPENVLHNVQTRRQLEEELCLKQDLRSLETLQCLARQELHAAKKIGWQEAWVPLRSEIHHRRHRPGGLRDLNGQPLQSWKRKESSSIW